MTSICAWRFSHMAADIEKLRSSTISRNATRTGHAALLSNLPDTVYLNGTPFRDKFCSKRKQEQPLFTESYGCFSFIVRTSSAKDDRAMTRSNWDR